MSQPSVRPPQESPAGNPQKKRLNPTDKIDRDINFASGIALLSGLVLLFVLPFALSTKKPVGYNPLHGSAWDLINVPILLGLGFGVAKRSRVCSVLLTIFAALVVLGRVIETKPGPWAVASVFYLFVFFRGTLAVFRYHALRRKARESPKIATSSDAASFAPEKGGTTKYVKPKFPQPKLPDPSQPSEESPKLSRKEVDETLELIVRMGELNEQEKLLSPERKLVSERLGQRREHN